MANTYSQIYFHLVFSTKNRVKWIDREIEGRVWAYMAGVAKHYGMSPIQIGGMEDHVHALLGIPTTLSSSQVAKHLKVDSSKWIHTEFANMRDFAWQDGYGVFSVSRSALKDVTEYIENQREHHESRSFEDEYRSLLEKHGVSFDEEYLLG